MPDVPAAERGARSLARWARAVRVLALLGMALLLVQPGVLLGAPDWIHAAGAAEMLGLTRVPDTAAQQLRAAAVSLLPVGVGLYALARLWLLFGEYGQGRVFGAVALRHWRHFAWATLVFAAVQPLARALMSVALTLDNPPGQRMLVIDLSSNDYIGMLGAAVMVAVASVMAEAGRTAEDNAGFV